MKRAIICFTRVPKPGVTKTRLLPILSGAQCAALHTAFLQDLAAVYRQVEADLFVTYAADPDWALLKQVFPGAVDFFPQEGGDLGEKMFRAICYVLQKGYGAVILTGADLPLMTASHPESGFDALTGADIAIGPTSDGGYYLVGMKAPHRAVFEKQRYGGSNVLDQTVSAAKNAGLTVGFAQCCDDVDTPEDLRNLLRRLDPESFTFRYLNQLKKEGVPL